MSDAVLILEVADDAAPDGFRPVGRVVEFDPIVEGGSLPAYRLELRLESLGAPAGDVMAAVAERLQLARVERWRVSGAGAKFLFDGFVRSYCPPPDGLSVVCSMRSNTPFGQSPPV